MTPEDKRAHKANLKRLAKDIVSSHGFGELITDSMMAAVHLDNLREYGEGATPDIDVSIHSQSMEPDDLRQVAILFNALANQLDKLTGDNNG